MLAKYVMQRKSDKSLKVLATTSEWHGESLAELHLEI